MKKFLVKTFVSGSAKEIIVFAVKPLDAKRHVQTFFKDCRVLKVTEITGVSSMAGKQVRQITS